MPGFQFLAADVADQFSPEDVIDVSRYVDDCVCGCRSHYSVKDGLIHAHGRPIFDKLMIDGDLVLRGNAELQRLPDLLAVSGSVYLSDCANLRIMPTRMYVGGDVHMERIKTRELPDTMVVDGSIYAAECPNLIEISGGVRSTAVFAPDCANLTSVAPSLELYALDLSRGPMAELPAGLTIKGELKLRHCSRLTSVEEGVSVGSLIDVTGCERLFTLPQSVQPTVVITDGMLFATECMILPKMSETEAAMCLGAKAIQAFPHHHLKNIERMQQPVMSIEHKFRNRDFARSFATLKSDRMRSPDNERFSWLNSKLDEDRLALAMKNAAIKRLT